MILYDSFGILQGSWGFFRREGGYLSLGFRFRFHFRYSFRFRCGGEIWRRWNQSIRLEEDGSSRITATIHESMD